MLFIVLLILSYFFYLYIKNKYTFWNKRGLKSPPATPIVGNFGKVMLLKESVQQCIANIYKRYPEERIVGLYRGFQPAVLIRDPELIKQILIKDFHYFQDRGRRLSNSKLSKNLFEVEGETWRMLRQKLTPLFTSRKLKDMVPIIQKCTDEYVKYVEYIVDKNIDHEIRSLKSKYTLKVIGSCAFGLNLDTYSNKENEFYMMAQRIFSLSTFSRCLFILDMIMPGIKNLFNTAEDVQEFFLNLVTKVIKERENEPMKRKDFMDLMIEIKEQGKLRKNIEEKISELEIDDTMIAAQALVFYAAGFETSSGAMSFMLHELAFHQDIQNKVYEEISQIMEKYNGELSYEAIKEMTYLEMVFDETLRIHPVASILIRKAQSDYNVPGTNVIVSKGTPIFISVNGLHKDKKYFPNPEIFNPENFSVDNKKQMFQCTYLPFGEGPRNCIGMRFAMVQSMMGMAAFLKKFKVEPSSRTKYVLDYNPQTLTLTSLDGIWLKISKR